MPNPTQESGALRAHETPLPPPGAIGDWSEAASATDRLEAAKLFERLKTLGLVEHPGEGGGLSAAIVERVMVRVARRVRQGDLFLSRRDDDVFLERVMRMMQRTRGERMPTLSPPPVPRAANRSWQAAYKMEQGPGARARRQGALGRARC